MNTKNSKFHPSGRLTTILATASCAALLAQVPTAFAAENEDDKIDFEEILVTATKRGSQTLIDVPIAIQAISGDSLRDRGVQDFADWAPSITGLRYEDLGPGDKRIFLRGVNSIGASTTGVYFDEAVITASSKEDGGGRNVDIKLYDINRIEVLKGPQGTLYGASSMSGTIKMIPNKPDLEGIDAYVDGSLGNTDGGGFNWDINAMINLPLVQDKAALRVVAWNVDRSGYVDNVRLGTNNINNEKTYGGRVMLRLAASENLTIDASIMIQRTDVGGTSRITPAGTIGHAPTDALPNFFGGDLKTVSFTKDEWSDNWEIYSLTANYEMENGTITATSNWFDRRLNFNFDSTPILIFLGAPVRAITHQPQSRRVWSNELRYASNWEGPIQMVVGGLIQQERTNFEVQVIASDATTGRALGPWDPENDFFTGSGIALFGRTNDGGINQEAIFGELSFEATEKLTATVGLRYFHSSQNSAELETHPFFGFGGGPRPPIKPNDSSDDKLTTKFNLAYKASDDLMIYATASQGFRVGGLNSAGIPVIAQIPRNFAPDSLWNYELGMKSRFAENKVILNVAIYQIDWSNMQSVSRDATGAFQFIANAGDTRIRGIEADVTLRPTDQLELTMGGAYTDTFLTKDQPGVTPGNIVEVAFPGHKGDPVPNVPEFTFNASAQYSFDVTEEIGGLFRVDYAWVGRSRTEFRPRGAEADGFNPHTEQIGGYNNFNARLGIETETWSAKLFVNNLFDTRGIVDSISSDQDPLAQLVTRPRTYGLNVTWRR
ncbi:MAG: TonB-dependent receptor [Alphaproteobacteria bacterium]|nr:TonB-dependent receptor [Alphaproteobacteria bacterium]